MRYFNVSHGLRGCYMPDSAYTIACATRRELKAALESEAKYLRDETTHGLTTRQIATITVAIWRDRACYLDFVVPYRNRGQHDYPFGLFVSNVTRACYLESQDGGA